jgi:hypothetical protein
MVNKQNTEKALLNPIVSNFRQDGVLLFNRANTNEAGQFPERTKNQAAPTPFS